MARRTGKDGNVTIDGTVVGHITDWSMADRPVIYTRRPCHSSTPTAIETHRIDRGGTFTAESNPDDGGQALLTLGSVTSVTSLWLRENSGTVHVISPAKVYGGVDLSRGAVVKRRYNWVSYG